MRRQNLQSYGGSFAWGGVVLFVGVVLLLDHMGVVSAAGLWRFWPMILVLAGIVNILDDCKRVWGICLLLAGTLLQLGQFGIVHVTWALLWPILIIGVGLSLMWGSLKARKAGLGSGDAPTGPGALNELAIFSGVEKRIMGKNFRGGLLMAIFGGIEIDLWQAEMEGDEAVLYINAIFGGVEIRVPDTWLVSSEGQGVFGGYSDTTHLRPPADAAQPRKTLVIRGAAIFGGVEIKN
jgi:cell wall-active antibiotic response 4TMS protein YvqF